MGVDAAHPEWLLALPVLAVSLIAARISWWRAANRAGRRAMQREAARLAIRLVWSTLLVVALSGAVVTRTIERQAVVFVLDTSASTAVVRDEGENAIRTAARELRADDLAGVILASRDARVEEPPTRELLFTRAPAAPADAARATDLAAGLRLASAIVPDGWATRVVLISDGRQTRGDAVATARDVAARGATVDVLPIGAESDAELRIERIDLPETAHRGDVATLTAQVFAGRATAGTVRVFRNDALLFERPTDFGSGRQELVLPLAVGEPGLHRYRVEVAASAPERDANDLNNSLGAVQRVVGPPRVLVVASSPQEAGFLPETLRALGADVAILGPGALPADLAAWARYDLTILVDVAAHALLPETMQLLEQYVRDLGHGLVMTGGPDSFGPGGYADTAVERALPVYMDLRGRGRQPHAALALVIDKSGSMQGAKMELAKEAAARSVRALQPADRVAVLAFDSVPQWVAPLTPASERQQLEQAIGSIYAGGGTEIYSALLSGFLGVRDEQADVKHIILLTDGRSGASGDYVELLRSMREARVTLSTVGVGDDVDGGLLQAMARSGRGRYHFAADPASVPSIFSQETVMATRTILVDQRFYPAAASAGPLLRGLGSVAPLDGYVAVTPKERAEVVLVAPEGDPVLAAWQYGLGRAVAWMPDTAGRWSADWAASPATTVLWGNIVAWLLPSTDAAALTTSVTTGDDSVEIVVTDSRDTDWDRPLPTQATLLGPNGSRIDVPLEPAGPGRYRARVPMPEPGAYVVQASQTLASGLEVRAASGWVAPYPPEFTAAGIDRSALEAIAAAGGGRVLNDVTEAVTAAPHAATARWPLWPLLLILAAATWPLEIAARRLSPPARLPSWLTHTLRTPARRRPRQVAHDSAQVTTERLLEHARALRARRR